MALHLSGDPKADELLSTDAFALLIGMVLDQQIPLERAFAAPSLLVERLGIALSPAAIAAMDSDKLVAAFVIKPALHRFPAAMAGRVQSLAQLILDRYQGNSSAIWLDCVDAKDLLKRVEQLPGFGKQKAKIFVALLGKQLEVQPAGWREVSAPFGEPGSLMSIADIVSQDSLQAVRDHKRAMKSARSSQASLQAIRSPGPK